MPDVLKYSVILHLFLKVKHCLLPNVTATIPLSYSFLSGPPNERWGSESSKTPGVCVHLFGDISLASESFKAQVLVKKGHWTDPLVANARQKYTPSSTPNNSNVLIPFLLNGWISHSQDHFQL